VCLRGQDIPLGFGGVTVAIGFAAAERPAAFCPRRGAGPSAMRGQGSGVDAWSERRSRVQASEPVQLRTASFGARRCCGWRDRPGQRLTRLCRVSGERRDAVLWRLELFRAYARDNKRDRQLGSFKAYAYPLSLGEWLGTAVQIGATVSWLRRYALRPLDAHDENARRIARQRRGLMELYGAVLVGALVACDAVLERELAPPLELELPDVESVVDVWDEARGERDGLAFSLGALGEAISIYGTCRDRGAALLPTVATKLLQAVGFAALALAVADEM